MVRKESLTTYRQITKLTLEEVGDTDVELAPVTGHVAVTGVTVHETVVIADIEAYHVEELDRHTAAEHDIETSVVRIIVIVHLVTFADGS